MSTLLDQLVRDAENTVESALPELKDIPGLFHALVSRVEASVPTILADVVGAVTHEPAEAPAEAPAQSQPEAPESQAADAAPPAEASTVATDATPAPEGTDAPPAAAPVPVELPGGTVQVQPKAGVTEGELNDARTAIQNAQSNLEQAYADLEDKLEGPLPATPPQVTSA